MEKHFTSTAFVFDKERVLLLFHKKLHSWLPPGGHVDSNETPIEAAKREVHEETGLDIEIVPQENIWIDIKGANSLYRPYLCLLENVPQHKDQPAHQHIDFMYLARLLPKKKQISLKEMNDFRWFSQEEVQAFKEEEIFPNVKKIILHLFDKKVPLSNML